MATVKNMVVVMSGGINSDGSLPKHVLDRCDYVLENKERFDVAVISSSFTLNLPPKCDQDGYLISEASAGYNYIRSKGFSKQLLCEQFSHDTLGSVFFSLDFIAKALSVQRIFFITSDFHVQRVRVMANYINELIGHFFEIDCVGLTTGQQVAERVAREEISISKFLEEYKNIKSRNELISHMVQNHKNYNHEYLGDRLANRIELLY